MMGLLFLEIVEGEKASDGCRHVLPVFFQRFSSLLRRLVGGFARARSTDRGLVGRGAGPGLGLLPLLEVWVVEEVV